MNSVDWVESLAKGVLILSLGDVLYNVVLALGSIAIARMLGSAGYGIYSLVLSVPLTIYSFINLNLDTGITRYVRFYFANGLADKALSVVKVSLLLKLLIGIGGTLLCLICAKPLSAMVIARPDLYNFVMFVSIVVLLESVYTYLLAVFTGFEEMWRNSVMKILYSITRVSLAVLLLSIGLQVIGALASYVLGMTAAVVVGLGFLTSIAMGKPKVGINTPTATRLAKELVSYSLPLYASSLISSATSIYQTLLLAHTLTDSEIGGYRALVNMQVLITVVLGPITVALLPLYTRISAKGNPEASINVLARSNRYVALVVVPLTLLSMVFAKEIVYLLYGSEYLFFAVYLPLMFASFLLAGLGSTAIPQLFNAIGKTKLNLVVTLVSTSIFIPMSYALTYVLGYKLWGFLTAVLVMNVVSTALYNLLLIKHVGGGIGIRSVAPIYLLSALALPLPALFLLMPAVLRPISLIRIACGGTLYTILYSILLVRFRALDEHDMDFLVKAFSSVPVLGSAIKFFIRIAIRFAPEYRSTKQI